MQSSYTSFRVFVVNICYKYRVELEAPHLKGPYFLKTQPACKSCLQFAPKRYFPLQPYRSETKRVSLLCGCERGCSSRTTNYIDTGGMSYVWSGGRAKASLVTSFYMFVQEQKTLLRIPIYNLTSSITIGNAESYRTLNFRHKIPHFCLFKIWYRELYVRNRKEALRSSVST